ncbi:transketolase C-terminal domain-containing protein [Olsenella sp. YH-ols2217]|uniref:Transketolase C-terminal domain-containing protein n=1 Tax=Kribbibacterium absianum TaxID=3044210 RepID=A0ABT6ZKP9_9ACTN|nr:MULTISPECIES: transketolase C-terminal domain-containing protein [unclassified Olsenella]MDJ1122362.1 transketolase C-terminal domain-containing protein [Olsenella sp. YH-ols2216]MDJ1129384.1 transketolase C-terminal domain-containing protein [Olsenella sp. YH-ols2217]
MFQLVDDRSQKGGELRAAVVQTLQAAMETNKQVVALEADLGGASGFTKIAKSHPNQFVQCGIAEADMMGIAAGMSSEGFVPFCHTFGPFATRRAFDQIYLSGAYAGNTVNIYGSDPGFTVAANGGTHTTYEDVALMRTIPGVVVCDAADAVQMAWIVNEFLGLGTGVHYVRGNRKNVRPVYAEGSTFELGRGNVVRPGTDVLVIAAGQLVSDALDAAEELAEKGVSVEVVDMFCIKPLDTELVCKEAVGKKAVVTFENHNVIGGLGEAVAATLCEAGVCVSFRRHGVSERFGQVGPADFLQQEYRLTAKDLVATIEGLFADHGHGHEEPVSDGR